MTALTTAAALIAFAANSLLCRFALRAGEIDAATFTAVRLASGAAVLVLLCARRMQRPALRRVLPSALALFLYAAPFSAAYTELSAGAGALLLFACVQVAMIGWGLARGERAGFPVWSGVLLALAGIVWLTRPGLKAPPRDHALWMALAGVSWAAYSLRGRRAAGDPVVHTAHNFLVSVPLALAWLALSSRGSTLHASPKGILLACTSGALASGLGYSIWYTALRGLTATQAAVVQLLVPVLTAAAGVVFLGEPASLRILLGGTTILAGVALALLKRA